MRPPLLGLRADGGEGIGAGHLARCLALAQAWRDRGGEVVLATGSAPAVWLDRYRDEGVDVVGPDGASAERWVVDGYGLAGPGGHARIDDRGVSGDDGADLVVDQNLGASAAEYPQGPGRVLAGPRYALLRRDLAAAAATHRPVERDGPPRVLVAPGGAPAAAVRRFAEEVAGRLRDAGAEVLHWTGGDDPLPALRSSDVAVAAAGSTIWELCAFGVPSVLVTVADNQVPLAAAVVAADLGVDGGRVRGEAGDADPGAVAELALELAADRPRRAAMAERQRSVVDGRGAARVATRLWGESLVAVPQAGAEGHAWEVSDAGGGIVALVRWGADAALRVSPHDDDWTAGATAAVLEAATRAAAAGTGAVEVCTQDAGLARALLDADLDPAPAPDTYRREASGP